MGIRSVSTELLLGRALNDIEIKHSPRVLYISGSMSVPVPSPRVAIVGTREPSDEGRKTAFSLASELAKRGVVVISGLAKGIDSEAHKGAIDAKGETIAVLGTPLNIFYPKENRQLQTEIMTNHLAVSQFPSNKPVYKSNFVIRNRTMALLCDASIIVEAGDSSGTLSQDWEALRLGRPLFIWKSVFNVPDLKWPEQMISYGARVLDDLSTVFEELPAENTPLGFPQW
ncbi:MAG: DNA-protecting protein DprA [Candidatus Thermoplasmatota archaeon]|nr:DNA-protecting protein DprA [Candidatus Thermoplasmatota archaeon]